MAKWNKTTFISCIKENCEPRVQTTAMDLVKFAEEDADLVSWGRGEGYGTMTFKCKSDDYGIIPLFHITTNGQIKFQLNYLRQKVKKKEILIKKKCRGKSEVFSTAVNDGRYPEWFEQTYPLLCEW